MNLGRVFLVPLCRGVLCVLTLLPCVALAAFADDFPAPPAGTHSISISAGSFFPVRLLPHQSSKLFGTAAAPSWSLTLTNPIGSNWYRGQFSIGVELLTFETSEPLSATGIGVTPKLLYTLTSLGRLRPFVEGGGGPLWTELGGRVPEQPGQFNFAVWGGAGCAWSLTAQWAVQAGFRLIHVSNAGTRSPNSGLNVGLPFVGLSYSFFK